MCPQYFNDSRRERFTVGAIPINRHNQPPRRQVKRQSRRYPNRAKRLDGKRKGKLNWVSIFNFRRQKSMYVTTSTIYMYLEIWRVSFITYSSTLAGRTFATRQFTLRTAPLNAKRHHECSPEADRLMLCIYGRHQLV